MRPPHIERWIAEGNTEALRAAGRKGGLTAARNRRMRQEELSEALRSMRRETRALDPFEAVLNEHGDMVPRADTGEYYVTR